MNPWESVAQGYQHGLDQGQAIQQRGLDRMAQQPSLYDRFMEGYIKERELKMKDKLAERQFASQEAMLRNAEERERHNKATEQWQMQNLERQRMDNLADRKAAVRKDISMNFPGTAAAYADPYWQAQGEIVGGLPQPSYYQPESYSENVSPDATAAISAGLAEPPSAAPKREIPLSGAGSQFAFKQQELQRKMQHDKQRDAAYQRIAQAKLTLASVAAKLGGAKVDLIGKQIQGLEQHLQYADSLDAARLNLLLAQIEATINPTVPFGGVVTPRDPKLVKVPEPGKDNFGFVPE